MTGSQLHLIHPLGFYLDQKSLKRSGLDYWHKLKVQEYDSFSDFTEKNPAANIYLVESDQGEVYSNVNFAPGDFLVFGSETTGLPQHLLSTYPKIKIPMIGAERSLNLSVAVGIVLYEALRQNNFEGLV